MQLWWQRSASSWASVRTFLARSLNFSNGQTVVLDTRVVRIRDSISERTGAIGTTACHVVVHVVIRALKNSRKSSNGVIEARQSSSKPSKSVSVDEIA
jgi:hypothetical protein